MPRKRFPLAVKLFNLELSQRTTPCARRFSCFLEGGFYVLPPSPPSSNGTAAFLGGGVNPPSSYEDFLGEGSRGVLIPPAPPLPPRPKRALFCLRGKLVEGPHGSPELAREGRMRKRGRRERKDKKKKKKEEEEEKRQTSARGEGFSWFERSPPQAEKNQGGVGGWSGSEEGGGGWVLRAAFGWHEAPPAYIRVGPSLNWLSMKSLRKGRCRACWCSLEQYFTSSDTSIRAAAAPAAIVASLRRPGTNSGYLHANPYAPPSHRTMRNVVGGSDSNG